MSRLFTFLGLSLIITGGLATTIYLIQNHLLPTDLLTLTEKLISTPPPLRVNLEPRAGTITQAGMLSETNRHRAENQVAPLTLNTQLNQAAAAKVEDMFRQQYFEHIGPDGRGPSDWVDDTHYEYLAVGENLALGNFQSDAELLQAWMDSPGHRANILNSKFTEIGLAARRGIFQGEETWLAVQTFARPTSVCPAPPSQATLNTRKAELIAREKELISLKNQIESLGNEVTTLAAQGKAKVEQGNQEIAEGNRIYKQTGDKDQAQPHWDKGEALQAEGEALLKQAETKQTELLALQNTYNQKVTEFNQLNQSTESLVNNLNQLIRTYNACVGQ